MNKYFEDLISIKLPLLSISELKNELLMVSSICISLENIKCIQEVFYENIEKVREINPNCAKYIERIDFFIKSDKSITNSFNVSQLSSESFKYVCLDPEDKLSPKEVKDAICYVLFKDINIIEQKDENVKCEKWQDCLIKLLLKTDLTSYTDEGNDELKISMVKLFKQIYKTPIRFSANVSEAGHVKVMGYYLSKHLKNVEAKNLSNEINALKNSFQIDIKDLLSKQQELEKLLRLTVNSLNNKIIGIQREIDEANTDIFQCCLARELIKKYNCEYEIVKPKESSDKYTIIFKKSKPITDKSRTLSEYLYSLTHSFLAEYHQYEDAAACIGIGKDKNGILEVFREYFDKFKKEIKKNQRTANLSANNIDGIFRYVYEYAMLILHPDLFPKTPSSDDEFVSKQMTEIRKLGLDQLEIKPENRHTELWDLCLQR